MLRKVVGQKRAPVEDYLSWLLRVTFKAENLAEIRPESIAVSNRTGPAMSQDAQLIHGYGVSRLGAFPSGKRWPRTAQRHDLCAHPREDG